MRLMKRLEKIASTLDGTLGLAVRDSKTGEECRINDQQVFPTASVFKLPLLVELLNQVEQGKVRWSDRIQLLEKHPSPGSGVLKEFLPGATVSIWDLAVLMIVLSDNTAADILYELVDGSNTITRTMQRLGLRHTTVVLDCKGLLNLSVGLDPNDRGQATLSITRDRLREGRFDLDGIAFQPSPSNNCSSPADMLELVSLILQGKVVSPTACTTILDLLLRQQLNERIPLLLPRPFQVAHKTGTLATVRNDVGVIYLPDGSPIIFCAFEKDVNPRNWRQGDMAIAEAALATYEAFVR